MFPFSFQAIKVQLMMTNRVFLYGKRNRNEKAKPRAIGAYSV
jgi:hypothetical protein